MRNYKIVNHIISTIRSYCYNEQIKIKVLFEYDEPRTIIVEMNGKDKLKIDLKEKNNELYNKPSECIKNIHDYLERIFEFKRI